MFGKTLLFLSAASLLAIPAQADAKKRGKWHHHHGYGKHDRHVRVYYGGPYYGSRYYGRRYVGYPYVAPYYGGYYGGYYPAYGGAYTPYYGGYRGRPYYGVRYVRVRR